MTFRAPSPVPQEQSSLPELATQVRAARQLVQARRMGPVAQTDLRLARHSLLQALEAYAAELTVRGMPIPPRLRDELRLLRQLD